MTEKICFIVTAIGESGTPTRERADNVYRYLIAPVCEELGYKPVRVDHVNAVDNINETVINYLKTAPMVIADMTDHNPNAFYELGFRQARELPLCSKICLCHKRASLLKPSTKRTVAVSLVARLFMMCSIICLTSCFILLYEQQPAKDSNLGDTNQATFILSSIPANAASKRMSSISS
ncbi:hypothetical protein RLL62_08515 [Streptococcus pneumoniae]|nr:hypothetical protein [Streptococcus pneumoniae]MDS9073964.1 hypothetical protein [Streptococcus pneumoniae]VNJ66081.1 Uncharacterised protein [Streptococcus pneumoniae]VNJ99633.1 Uncharacterised protein [Streptococcus pneumoniae]